MVLKNITVADEAKKMYIKRMNNFLLSRLDASSLTVTSSPSTLELRQRHAEYKFEALDYFSIRSTAGRDSRLWKLERDLEDAFETFRSLNKKRQESSLEISRN